MRGQSLLTGFGLVSLLIGCGGGGSDTTSGPSTGGGNAVTVSNNVYSPASLSVPVNTTVTWTWANGATDHSVTFNDGGPSSPTQASGTFQRAFPTAGTYPYHCVIHANMTGTITVTAAGMTGTGGGGTGGSGMGGGGGGYP